MVSNIGNWMFGAAAAWLMTSLSRDALLVALVQVAASLPLFLFAIPAGVLADLFDRRRFLIASEVAGTVLCAVFAILVSMGRVTPVLVLVFVTLVGVTTALMYPVWQSIVPSLVPRPDLGGAIAANSAGVNVSRAIGPALGGVLIGALGIATPFFVDAASNLGVIGALLWWRPEPVQRRYPGEHFGGAVIAGFRYARNSPALRAAGGRAFAFFLFASAYWALLPLVARYQIAGGPELYGALLGTIGASAVAGAFLLPHIKARIGANGTVALASLGTALALVLFGMARDVFVAGAACVIAGVCWIVALATINVSAQISLPDWVRGRGLALYTTVMFGSLTAGSALWGRLAVVAGLAPAHFIAAGGAVLGVVLTLKLRLPEGAAPDLGPANFWPSPVASDGLLANDPPVMVEIEYRLAEGADGRAFVKAIEAYSAERRRDGAYSWAVYQDTADTSVYREVFLVASWSEHMRQHERVTNADRAVQEGFSVFLTGEPMIRHNVRPI